MEQGHALHLQFLRGAGVSASQARAVPLRHTSRRPPMFYRKLTSLYSLSPGLSTHVRDMRTTLAFLVVVVAGLEGASRDAKLGAVGTADSNVIARAAEMSAPEQTALGAQLYSQARYHEAELVFRQALAAWERLGPAGARDHAVTGGNLGAVLRIEGRFAEAETILLDSLHETETVTGLNSSETGHAASNLASLYIGWEDLPKAESYALRANAIFDTLGQGRTRDRVNNWRLLASIYIGQSRYDLAKARLNDVLADPNDLLAPGAYNDLAVLALQQHEFADAESLARRALEVADRILPAAHPMRAAALNSLAQACRFQKEYAEAEKYYHEAIAAWTASVGAAHADTAKSITNLAALYHERGRESAAEQLYRQAVEIFDSAEGSNHPLTLVARNELADVLRAEGRLTEADKLSRVTLASLEQTLGDHDRRVTRARENRIRLLEANKQPTEAAALRSRIAGLSNSLLEP